MKINRNRLIFIFITSIFLIVLYGTGRRVENYEKDIIKYIDTTKKLDPVVAMEAASELTDSEEMIQKAWDLAEAQNHIKLRKLFTILKEFSNGS